MFISNNCGSFHFWWRENLAKHQKVSKYYESDFLQIFLLLFMSLLTAPIVKSSHIWARIYFIFLKNVLKQTWKPFNTNSRPQWKDRKSIYQVRQILALFCNVIALNLSWNFAKSFTVTKIVKEIKFEGIWGKLEAKKCFQRQSCPKYLRVPLVFMWNSALREKFSFCFLGVFASTSKVFILAAKLSTRLLFYDV